MTGVLHQYSLKGQTALVTGAGGHLGSVMCRALAEAGAHVLANSRNRANVAKLVEDCRIGGLSVEPAIFDVTEGDSIRTFFGTRENMPLSVIVNNAYSGTLGNISYSE